MKVAIVHPNLHYFGGGELVALTVAEALEHPVTILCNKYIDINVLREYWGLKLNNVTIRSLGPMLPFSQLGPALRLRKFMRVANGFDLVLDTGTNGWFTHKLKCPSIAYVHFPNFQNKKTGYKSIVNPLLIGKQDGGVYTQILVNSKFTQRFMKGEVVYPPVRLPKSVKRKTKKIVTVGRLSSDKKHEVLIEAFQQLTTDYTFHIIGAFNDADLYDASYLDKLEKLAKGSNITIHKNLSRNEVLEELQSADIYWHARGYGESSPEAYENFGITTVEAMACGCIPMVINLGAQPEIVDHGITGFVWSTKKQLITYTRQHMKNNIISRKKVRDSAKKYSEEVFIEKIRQLVARYE